jgi:MFS family permease
MLLATVLPRTRTGFYFGVMNTSIQIGNLIGPLVGRVLIVTVGFHGSFLVSSGVLFCCALAITVGARGASSLAPTLHAPRLKLRDALTPFAWPALRGVLIVGLIAPAVYSGATAMLALYVQELVRPEWLTTELCVGLAVGLGALAAAAGMLWLGSLADRTDARVLLAAAIAVMSVSFVAQALVPNAVAFIALRMLTGVGLAGITASTAVLTRAAAPDGAEGRVFAAYGAAQNLGWGAGPLIAGVIAAPLGISLLYVAAAGVSAILALVIWTRSAWFAPRQKWFAIR